MSQEQQRILSFGRRIGRSLSPIQKELVEKLLPKLIIADNEKNLFSSEINQICLEIGFGMGDHLARRVKENPQIGFIGCEPFINGVATLLKIIEQDQISNIRIWIDDARILLEQMQDATLEKIYILYPDPWPKLKHHKRRLINPDFLKLLASKLLTGGELQIATDHQDYAKWILQRMVASTDFQWSAKAHADWQIPPLDFIPTRYHCRAEALGINSYYFNFTKREINI